MYSCGELLLFQDCMGKLYEAAVAFFEIAEAEVRKGKGFLTLITGFKSCLCYISLKIVFYESLDLVDH